MLSRRWAAALVGAASSVSLFAAPTSSFASGTDPVGCRANDPSPLCVVTATNPSTPGHGGGSSGTAACHEPNTSIVWPCILKDAGWLGSDGCYWHQMTAKELASQGALLPPPMPPAHWYEGVCGDPFTEHWVATKFRVYAGAPQLALLAQEAVKLLRLPRPGVEVSPPAGVMQLVHVPTWLWVDPATYRARSASASAGGVTVTATATPVRAVWRMGDGSTVTCGPGTAWRSSYGAGSPSPTCGHTYTRTSAGQPRQMFIVSATVTWQVTWRGGGGSGRVPDLVTTGSVAVSVGQAETVVET